MPSSPFAWPVTEGPVAELAAIPAACRGNFFLYGERRKLAARMSP